MDASSAYNVHVVWQDLYVISGLLSGQSLNGWRPVKQPGGYKGRAMLCQPLHSLVCIHSRLFSKNAL